MFDWKKTELSVTTANEISCSHGSHLKPKAIQSCVVCEHIKCHKSNKTGHVCVDLNGLTPAERDLATIIANERTIEKPAKPASGLHVLGDAPLQR